jgi:hypothetical protein
VEADDRLVNAWSSKRTAKDAVQDIHDKDWLDRETPSPTSLKVILRFA